LGRDRSLAAARRILTGRFSGAQIQGVKYARFEDLPVWKTALNLAVNVYALTRNRCFAQSGDLRDQLRRAALSVSNNIAEGFERGSTAELLQFIYIARGSAGEVRSMLHVVERLPGTDDLKSEISNLKLLAENCGRQLRGWADSLQNSEIKGQRHLTAKSRRGYEARRHSEDFQRENLERLRRARPDIFGEPEEKE